MIIRRAQLEDAPGIADVHVDSWRTTYKNIIPDYYFQNLSYTQRTALWEKNLSKQHQYSLVADNSNGQIIGFADAWKRETNNVTHSCDLTSIYILEEYQGQGIGKLLLKDLFGYFKKMAYHRIFVEVLTDNKTRYFYQYYGAKLIDTKDIQIGGVLLKEEIYEWDTLEDVLGKV